MCEILTIRDYHIGFCSYEISPFFAVSTIPLAKLLVICDLRICLCRWLGLFAFHGYFTVSLTRILFYSIPHIPSILSTDNRQNAFQLHSTCVATFTPIFWKENKTLMHYLKISQTTWYENYLRSPQLSPRTQSTINKCRIDFSHPKWNYLK